MQIQGANCVTQVEDHQFHTCVSSGFWGECHPVLENGYFSLYPFLPKSQKKGYGKRGVDLFFKYPVIGCMGIVQSCVRGGLDWTLGSISLLRR